MGKFLIELALLLALLHALARIIDHHYPPDLSRYHDLSPITTDRYGIPLHIGLTRDEQYRLPVTALPRHYRAMLIAYEDQRFERHHGVDPLAILRAVWQNLRHGRTVSGASTLTMQTARLLEPRPRTLKNKLIEAFRAWQLERRYSKDDILTIYATLAPMGGNREGIETAARHYFGKPAAALSIAESAWLIALPQSPNRLKHPEKAQAAAARVLAIAHERHAIPAHDHALAQRDAVRPGEYPFPALARHYRERHRDQRHTPLDARLQHAFEQRLHQALAHEHTSATLAAILLDNQSGEPLAYIGNADYFSRPRHGAVDILAAIRSPGSTLKPFAYLEAFNRFHYRPDTLIDDTPIHEHRWRPSNYDGRYLGRIPLADALALSRNIPAVRLLLELDPGEFASHLARHGLPLHFARHAQPGPALILGGTGVRPAELARLYRELALCTWHQDTPTLASKTACQQITRILRKSASIRHGREILALKTGTSYGWRDLWLAGYTRRHTLILWRGRADGGFAGELDSSESLIPLYQELIDRLPDPSPKAYPIAALPPRPLPNAIRHSGERDRFAIASPADGSLLELPPGASLQLIARHGKPPYHWFINERHTALTPQAQLDYQPPSPGHYRIRILDAEGNSAHASFRLQPPAAPERHSVTLQRDTP
ncbi:MAG: transglycosylase domain-containing protein [Cardiobacteriaceae bacterium]|nr:transglycosylase domain-containing protein [Cardiobacteriaceae bacterium]